MDDDGAARLWFDYVDPVSFLVEVRLRRVEAASGTAAVERLPWEIVPPPEPLLDPDDPAWVGRWRQVERESREEGLELRRAHLVPWTRKAHELVLHATGGPAFDRVHGAVFRAHHVEGRDIGRIDVLADIAEAAGLDAAEIRTVLGVDRYLPALLG
ncbi:MAG TPA: DsbA family protein, partial [Longimicrobiales bacterium]|nr:DsbA family protein [Longimicrobiales bacterium]